MFLYILVETGTEDRPQVMVLSSEEEYDLTTDDFKFILRMFAEQAVNNSYTPLDYYEEFERLLQQERGGYVGLYKRSLDSTALDGVECVQHNDHLWSRLYVEKFSLAREHDRAISAIPS